MRAGKVFILMGLVLVMLGVGACGGDSANFSNHNLQSFERGVVDFSGVKFTAWDSAGASNSVETRAVKPYTIMVYMNGSDLESESGAATLDLIEMLESGIDSRYANVVVFTGGASKWRNQVVPSNTCVIWELLDGYINKVASVGLKDMGDAGTLAGFIDFSLEVFPAQKYGLIFWDHGGGSIAGFGSDEKFNNSNLTLMDMNCAFERSRLRDIPLEFMGFDACLMATVEMAVVASDYANYLIASQDLEPGDGWDYAFLSAINSNPDISGAELGAIIVDTFFNFYGNNFWGDLSLSVIDLRNVSYVMQGMGELMNLCSDALYRETVSAFDALSKKRYVTKTFGVGSPVNNYIDMVDIGDMAKKLSTYFPQESAQVIAALNSCVIKNRYNLSTALCGLSCYYIYGGKNTGTRSLSIYEELKMNESYTRYLFDFFAYLGGKAKSQSEIVAYDERGFRDERGSRNEKGSHSEKDFYNENDFQSIGNSQSERGAQTENGFQSERGAQNRGGSQHLNNVVRSDLTLWRGDERDCQVMVGIINDIEEARVGEIISGARLAKIYDRDLCLFEIHKTESEQLLSSPIRINGENADVVVLINADFPNGKVLGTRKQQGFKIQKGYNEIIAGDLIACCYLTRDDTSDKWRLSEQSSSDFANDKWRFGEEFMVQNGELVIEWVEPDKSVSYSVMRTDTRNQVRYIDLHSAKLQNGKLACKDDEMLRVAV